MINGNHNGHSTTAPTSSIDAPTGHAVAHDARPDVERPKPCSKRLDGGPAHIYWCLLDPGHEGDCKGPPAYEAWRREQRR